MIQTSTKYVNDIIINKTGTVHINRIYHKGEIYWGNEPHTNQRYMPAHYCQNDNNNSPSQLAHATFSIPWAPSPTISHKIVTEFIPMSMPGNSYGYAVFFGGNVSNLRHMANVFGGDAHLNGNCGFGAYDPNVEFRNYIQYYNKLWRVEIESQAGTSNSHSYNVKIDVDGTNMINSPGSSRNSITGTFDPYFIFGGQILRSDSMFRQIYMKMYSFDIYDDNVLVYSLRPYYDTVDQLYGMYDLVNDRFYSSMNSAYPFTGEL